MLPQIDEIVLPKTLAKTYTAEGSLNSLKGIKRLNVFFGPNNCGKSRLIRGLFSGVDQLRAFPFDNKAKEILTSVSDAKQLFETYKNAASPQDRQAIADVKALFEDESLFLAEIGHGFSWPSNYQSTVVGAIRLLENKFSRFMGSYPSSVENSARALRDKLKDLSQTMVAFSSGISYSSPERIYIPALRGLRPLEDGANQTKTYLNRTVDDYFATDATDAMPKLKESSIFTGLGLYGYVTERLLGNASQRESIRKFEQFLSKSFYNPKPITLIPRHGKDTLHITIGNEEERPIASLGDGVQQLIVLTFPMFQHDTESPLFLFIEEPDLFLHAGFQRLFIKAVLESEIKNLYVFVTTHSNHFLDITLETDSIAVYKCDKKPLAEDTQNQTPQFTVANAGQANKEILAHVGVKPSSLMLANCTIWVEGITDILYFGKYLELYFQKENLAFHNDLHYAFVEYNGNNIEHWSFLNEERTNVERICADLMLVADSDNATGNSKKAKRLRKLEENLGEQFLKLEVREVENLLTPEVILAVIRDYEGTDSLELKSFTQSAYRKKYLGEFIDKHVFNDVTTSKRFKDSLKQRESKGIDTDQASGYKDKSGTVKNKIDFCNKAISRLTDFEKLSDEAKRATERIASFIKERNHS